MARQLAEIEPSRIAREFHNPEILIHQSVAITPARLIDFLIEGRKTGFPYNDPSNADVYKRFRGIVDRHGTPHSINTGIEAKAVGSNGIPIVERILEQDIIFRDTPEIGIWTRGNPRSRSIELWSNQIAAQRSPMFRHEERVSNDPDMTLVLGSSEYDYEKIIALRPSDISSTVFGKDQTSLSLRPISLSALWLLAGFIDRTYRRKDSLGQKINLKLFYAAYPGSETASRRAATAERLWAER